MVSFITKYYLRIDGQQLGPFKKYELLENGLKRDTLVWSQKLTNWTPAYKVSDLASLLEKLPPELEQETEPESVAPPETVPQQQEQQPAAEEPPKLEESKANEPAPTKYYLHIDDKDVGPFTIEDLEAIGITPGTYVWHKGMPQWARVEKVEALAHLIVNDETPLQVNTDDDETPPPYIPPVNTTPPPQPPPWQPQASRVEQNTSYEAPPPRRDSLTQAIITLVFCNPLTFAIIAEISHKHRDRGGLVAIAFLITLTLGIIAVNKAGRSRAAYARRNYNLSESLGGTARMLCSIIYWIFFITFIICAA